MITFTINESPVSINKLYFQPRGAKFKVLTPIGRAFKEKVYECICNSLSSSDSTILANFEGMKLEAELTYNSNWFNKDGSIKKKDITNYEKAVMDSLFDAFKQKNLNIDDSQIFRFIMVKNESKDESINITLKLV